MKSVWFAYAMIWLSVSIAVSVGLYFTRNIHCLWFLMMPSFTSVKSSSDDKDDKESDKGKAE